MPCTVLNYSPTPSQKDREDLEEVSTELQLADEDELVPYVLPILYCSTDSCPACKFRTDRPYSYKVGDSFVSLPLPEVQEMLSESTEQIDQEVSNLEESLSGIRDEMKELKVQLYARFGKSINLET